MHCEEWLAPGHTEVIDELGTHVIPDPSFHQEMEAYEGPTPNGYTETEWAVLAHDQTQGSGVERTQSILGAVQATGLGYWNSQDTLLTWKTRHNINTPLGPVVLWGLVYSMTPISGNIGWPFAVGNSWYCVYMSSIPSMPYSYHEVVGVETIDCGGYLPSLDCFKVENYAWDDWLGPERGVPEPIELTLSSTNWWSNDYGCPIRMENVPGGLYKLYDGWEHLCLIWYGPDPPFPPFEPWDVNGDGYVNEDDMDLVYEHFGATGDPGWIREDVKQDGRIDVLDMILVGQHWSP
jgi:hypothetical protein